MQDMDSAIISVIYFTVTLHLTFTSPDFTVMVTVPFFFALTTPLELTVAILVLLDL